MCTPVTWLVPFHHVGPNLNNEDISGLISPVCTQSWLPTLNSPSSSFHLTFLFVWLQPFFLNFPAISCRKWMVSNVVTVFVWNRIIVLINRHQQQGNWIKRAWPNVCLKWLMCMTYESNIRSERAALVFYMVSLNCNELLFIHQSIGSCTMEVWVTPQLCAAFHLHDTCSHSQISKLAPHWSWIHFINVNELV